MSDTSGPCEPPPELVTAAFEAVDDLLFLFGPNGRLRYANEALLAVTGTPGDAVGTTTPASFVADADVDRVAAAVEAAIETGAATVETGVVTDDAPGIPPEERERVLERGYSTADGTGLGLRIVAEIAAAHGWELSVTESESWGARFELTGVA